MHFPRGADYLLHLTQSLHSFWGFSILYSVEVPLYALATCLCYLHAVFGQQGDTKTELRGVLC